MITTKNEKARGCGYRKPGGFYMIGGKGNGFSCGLLPVSLHVCSYCGSGIKFSRGFTWIKPALLFDSKPVDACKGSCGMCPFITLAAAGRIGLMWVGEKFYTPTKFIDEARDMGVSKRLAQIPKDFQPGVTWVALAHRKAVDGKSPGIFYLFKPEGFEYVVKGDETPEELERIVKRGIKLVKVNQI